jgi:hypothetical protein
MSLVATQAPEGEPSNVWQQLKDHCESLPGDPSQSEDEDSEGWDL